MITNNIYKIILALSFVISFLIHQNGFSANTIKVTVVSDGHETVLSKSFRVVKGKKSTFTIKAKKGYIYSKLVAGDCPPGKWKKSIYTTGRITKACKVYFSAGRVVAE